MEILFRPAIGTTRKGYSAIMLVKNAISMVRKELMYT